MLFSFFPMYGGGACAHSLTHPHYSEWETSAGGDDTFDVLQLPMMKPPTRPVLPVKIVLLLAGQAGGAHNMCTGSGSENPRVCTTHEPALLYKGVLLNGGRVPFAHSLVRAGLVFACSFERLRFALELKMTFRLDLHGSTARISVVSPP